MSMYYERLIVFEAVIVAIIAVIAAAPLIKPSDTTDLLEETSWADGHGNYIFSYRTTDGTYRMEKGSVVSLPGTNRTIVAVEGRVEWVASDGSQQMYYYTADENGYRTSQGSSSIEGSMPVENERGRTTQEKADGPGDQGIHGSGCTENQGGPDCDMFGDIMQGDEGDRPERPSSRRT